MEKRKLIKELASMPDYVEVEIALKGRNNNGSYMRRLVMGVERRHDEKKGKDYISLVCYKSLKEQSDIEKQGREMTKALIARAKLLLQQKDEEGRIARKVEQARRNGCNFDNVQPDYGGYHFGKNDFGNFGTATFANQEARQQQDGQHRHEAGSDTEDAQHQPSEANDTEDGH